MTKKSSKAKASRPEPKRCAIYTRKSTARGLEQEFNSLDAQREACEHYVQARKGEGWQLLPEHYDDGGFTGANTKRPAFQRLLQDIEAGKLDVVVVYKVDRLSRSLLDFAKMMERFHNSGVAFVSVTQNFSTANAMGRLTLNLLMAFAEFEREMIAERTKDKIAASRRRGKWTGGQLPIGYDAKDKKLVPNKLEAALVGEIFTQYEEHRSALVVARELNRTGRTTKRRAKNGKLGKGNKWSKHAVLTVLRNPVFAGYIPYDDKLYDGEHDAIVDQEQFGRVQALLNSQYLRRRTPGRNPAYLLRGILRCGQCGSRMSTASTRKDSREYRYYRCSERDKRGVDACGARQLPAEPIEAFVVEQLRDVTKDGALAADVTSRLRTRIKQKRKPLQTERQELPRKIASLSAEGSRLVDQLGKVTGAGHRLIEDQLHDLGEAINHAEVRLSKVQHALTSLDQTEVETKWVAGMLEDFHAVWDSMSLQNRERLVQAVVQSVIVDEKSGNVSVALVDLGLHQPEALEVNA